jgi:hypothetical protein
MEYFPVPHPCFNLALPSNNVTESCKSFVSSFNSVGDNESKDAVNEKTECAKSGPTY